MQIELNELLIRKTVYAISKAVTEDLPQERRENFKETNNRYRTAVGDFINDNLRKLVIDENITLLPFNRGGWDARILVDNIGKVTYNIMRNKTLQRAIAAKRTTPYYLQSILVFENGDCEGHNKQLSLFGEEPAAFTQEEYEEDYDRIIQGQIEKEAGYHHYIITYDTTHNEIRAITLLFLDKDFAVIDSMNLASYLTPDFAALTSTTNDSFLMPAETAQEKPKEGLVKVRVGVKPVLRIDEQEA